MGLAASQGRLLSLTSRLSDLELRSQVLSNQKVALSTASSEASSKYIKALSNNYINLYDINGEYQQANASLLTGYGAPTGTDQLMLQNELGQVICSKDVLSAFEVANGNLDKFLGEFNVARVDAKSYSKGTLSGISSTSYNITGGTSRIDAGLVLTDPNSGVTAQLDNAQKALDNLGWQSDWGDEFGGALRAIGTLLTTQGGILGDEDLISTGKFVNNVVKSDDYKQNPYWINSAQLAMEVGKDINVGAEKAFSVNGADYLKDKTGDSTFKKALKQMEDNLVKSFNQNGSLTQDQLDQIKNNANMAKAVLATIAITNAKDFPIHNNGRPVYPNDYRGILPGRDLKMETNLYNLSDIYVVIFEAIQSGKITPNLSNINMKYVDNIEDRIDYKPYKTQTIIGYDDGYDDGTVSKAPSPIYSDVTLPSDAVHTNYTEISENHPHKTTYMSGTVSVGESWVDNWITNTYWAGDVQTQNLENGSVTWCSNADQFMQYLNNGRVDQGSAVENQPDYVNKYLNVYKAKLQSVLDRVEESVHDVDANIAEMIKEETEKINGDGGENKGYIGNLTDEVNKFMEESGKIFPPDSPNGKKLLEYVQELNDFKDSGKPYDRNALKAIEELINKILGLVGDSSNYDILMSDEYSVNYYTNLFDALTNCGACAVDDDTMRDPDWLNEQLTVGNIYVSLVGETGLERKQYSTSFDYISVDNLSDADLTQAKAEYDAAVNKITRKEKKIDRELANIETEHTAVKNEIESIKTSRDANIERSFNLFS